MINNVFQFVELDVSYASLHAFSKVTMFVTAVCIIFLLSNECFIIAGRIIQVNVLEKGIFSVGCKPEKRIEEFSDSAQASVIYC